VLFNAASDPMFAFDLEIGPLYGVILYANEAACELTGYSEGELIGRKVSELNPNVDPMGRSEAAKQLTTGHVVRREELVIRKDRSQVLVETHIQTLMVRGQPMGLAMARDVSHRVRERKHMETLTREIHHRVKNSLQGLIGLLDREAGISPAAAPALRRIEHQILAIQAVHGLQEKASAGAVELAQLISAIVESQQLSSAIPIQFNNDAGEGRAILPQGEAVPVALILNELFTNGINHTSPGDGAIINCHLSWENETIKITLTNAPATLPDGFELPSSEHYGNGLSLVRFLLPRKGGKLKLSQVNQSVTAELLLTPPVIERLIPT